MDSGQVSDIGKEKNRSVGARRGGIYDFSFKNKSTFYSGFNLNVTEKLSHVLSKWQKTRGEIWPSQFTTSRGQILVCNCKGGIVEDVFVCVHVFMFVYTYKHTGNTTLTYVCVYVCAQVRDQARASFFRQHLSCFLEAGSHFFFKSGDKEVSQVGQTAHLHAPCQDDKHKVQCLTFFILWF